MADTFKILGGLFGGTAGLNAGSNIDAQKEQAKKAAEQRQQAEYAQLGNSLLNKQENSMVSVPKLEYQELLQKVQAYEQEQQSRQGLNVTA